MLKHRTFASVVEDGERKEGVDKESISFCFRPTRVCYELVCLESLRDREQEYAILSASSFRSPLTLSSRTARQCYENKDAECIKKIIKLSNAAFRNSKNRTFSSKPSDISQETTLPITKLSQNQDVHFLTSHQKEKQPNQIQSRAFPATQPIWMSSHKYSSATSLARVLTSQVLNQKESGWR